MRVQGCVHRVVLSNVFSVRLGDGYHIGLGFTLLLHVLEYDTSGCSLAISWLPSYGILRRSMHNQPHAQQMNARNVHLGDLHCIFANLFNINAITVKWRLRSKHGVRNLTGDFIILMRVNFCPLSSFLSCDQSEAMQICYPAQYP